VHRNSTHFIDAPSITTSKDKPTSALRSSGELLGRILLMSLFLFSGVGKLSAYAAKAGYMASMGVPSAALPLVIALEVLGSLAIIVGWRTRVVSLLLCRLYAGHRPALP
jgi:putative oxidoreductase